MSEEKKQQIIFKSTINRVKEKRQIYSIYILRLLFVMVLFFLPMIAVVLLGKFIDVKIILIVSIILFGLIYSLFLKKFFKETKIIGKIELNQEQIYIEFDKQKYMQPLKQAGDMRITFHSYKGMTNGRVEYDGDDNIISFYNKQGAKLEYLFSIDSIEHLEDLKSLFSVWYKEGIKFKEYYLGSRSYFLKTNLKYDEVQDFKEKYDIEWV